MEKKTKNFSKDFELEGRVLESFVVLDVTYTWYPPEPMTQDFPGEPANIEVESIKSHGQDVTYFVTSFHPNLAGIVKLACWEHIEHLLKEDI